MVPMQVGDEDLGDLSRLDAALLNLYLRSLSTVEYPDLSIVCMEAVFTLQRPCEGIDYLAAVPYKKLLW